MQALIGWYGPYNVRPLYDFAKSAPLEKMTTPDRERTLGGLLFLTASVPAEQEALLTTACAANHLDPADPPALLLHGSADTVVPASQSLTFRDQMRSVGINVTHYEIADVNHDWSHPEPARASAAAQQALDLTTAWLEKTLLPVGPVSAKKD